MTPSTDHEEEPEESQNTQPPIDAINSMTEENALAWITKNSEGIDYQKALDMAMKKGYLQVVSKLIDKYEKEKGKDLSDGSFRTAFNTAIKMGHIKIAKKLGNVNCD